MLSSANITLAQIKIKHSAIMSAKKYFGSRWRDIHGNLPLILRKIDLTIRPNARNLTIIRHKIGTAVDAGVEKDLENRENKIGLFA